MATDAESLNDLIKKRHKEILLRQERMQIMIDMLGELLYPGAVGKKVVVYTDINRIDYTNSHLCIGYVVDRNSDVVMELLDDAGYPLVYERNSLVRYIIDENEQ